jgi:histidine ammonia-lyase
MQAADCLKIQDKLAPKTRAIYDEIREFFPVFSDDKPKYKEIEQMINFLKTFRCKGKTSFEI